MAIGSGLGASIGVASESTYGTYVAPTKFFEFQSEDLKKQKTTVQGGGLAAGRFAQLGSRRALTAEAGQGSVSMDVPNKGFGLWLQTLMGTTVTPVQQATTTAYLQTHALADNFGKSLTVQKGVPQTDGTVKPYTFLGCKATSAEFSCGIGELLNVKYNLDARQVVENQTLAAPSYATGLGNWDWTDMTLKLGTFGSEAAVQGVTKVTVNVERGMKTDRQYAGNAGLKAEPITNDYVKISGSIDADYLDKTVFADRFASDSPTSLVWTFQGPLIASTYYYTFTITLPMVFIDGDTPTVGGPDVVSGSFPFVVQSDGTNPIATISYTSTDVTL